MDILEGLESGEKFRLSVKGLEYDIELPIVRIPSNGRVLKIASLNLVGQTRLNTDLGRLLAEKIRTRGSESFDSAAYVFYIAVPRQKRVGIWVGH